MGEPSLDLTESAKQSARALDEYDEVFKHILGDLAQMIIENAGGSVGKILDLSSNFIDQKAQKALSDFRGLYFFNKKIAMQSTAINESVDEIFDELSNKLSNGEEVDFNEISESDLGGSAENRMALSGLQKQLEQVISLDESIKEKLLPILSTMQFEDMIRQRIEHVRDGWIDIVEGQKKGLMQLYSVLEGIGESLTSDSERQAYYPRVLGRKPPEGVTEEQSIEDILF